MLASFLDPSFPSLKICGVTTDYDASRLALLGVDGLGVNFWPQSKRYLAPRSADFLLEQAGKILRVGVFVNAGPDLPKRLFSEGLIDLVQLHGDETPEDARSLVEAGIPFIRATGVRGMADLASVRKFGAQGILLDAHAPGVYGGTGETIDWELAGTFARENPDLAVILAGGITPENVASALLAVKPAAIDIASGAESAPGVKDFAKVEALLKACQGTRGEA